nr:hypothetical protein Itr_chr09CG04360 [Ipomoea trifida]
MYYVAYGLWAFALHWVQLYTYNYTMEKKKNIALQICKSRPRPMGLENFGPISYRTGRSGYGAQRRPPIAVDRFFCLALSPAVQEHDLPERIVCPPPLILGATSSKPIRNAGDRRAVDGFPPLAETRLVIHDGDAGGHPNSIQAAHSDPFLASVFYNSL